MHETSRYHVLVAPFECYTALHALHTHSWPSHALSRVHAADVNVADLSMRRADGAMGRNKMTQKEDCVHYCMPGVPDSLARLVFNALIDEPPLDGSSRPSSPTAAPEWESLPGMASLTEWLSQRGVSKAFDPAIGLYHSDQADIERVDAQPW